MTIQYRGTGTSGNSGATSVSSQAITLPTGFAAGDLLFVILRLGSSSVTAFHQSAGTGTWTVDFEAQYATGGITYAVAHRVIASGDTAPTFAWTTATTTSWSCGGFLSSIGAALSVDKYATGDPAANGTLGNTITPNAVTAAGPGEASIILTDARAPTSAATTSHTYTPPTGWTWTDGDAAFFSSATQNARFSAHAYQLGVSGTVTPGSQSLTDSASDSFFFVVFHALVQEAAPVPRPQGPLRGRMAAARGRLASIQVRPPATGGPAAPFFPPRVLLRGPPRAARGRLTAARGQPGRPSPFRLPGLLRGPAAAAPGKMMHGSNPQPVVLPGVPSPFRLPGLLRGQPAAARGRLTGQRGRPGVPSPFRLPGLLRGQPAARKGTLAGIAAPPPVIHPNIPAPFFPPRVLLRGPAATMARTRQTGIIAPPPAPPPPALQAWQGSTHIIAADATGNLIQGARHTGKGGPGPDLKGDYQRSGD